MSKPIYLDPLNQAVADQFATQPPIEDLSVEEFRKLFDQIQQHDLIPGVTRTSFNIQFEDGFKVFVFKTTGAKGSLPVIFYLHGGGWLSGNVNSYDSICRDLALKTGYAVAFVEYSLAPEARFPTQHEQCYAAVKWVSQHGNKKGLSQDTFAIMGDSAGGQLTAAVNILCVSRKPVIPIKYQILLSPSLDAVTTDRDTPSEFLFFNGPVLTVPFMRKAIENYIPSPTDRNTELASPLLNITPEHAKQQPRTLIMNSAVDPLRDDGILYGEVLQRAGVDCAIFTAHGQLHDSLVLEATRKGETPRAEMSLIAVRIREVLGVSDGGLGGMNGGTKKKAVASSAANEESNGVGEEKEKEKRVNTRARKRTRKS